MVSAVWRMSPVAFKEMWEQFHYDRLPYPMQVRSTSPTLGEYADERSVALQEAHRTLTEWYEPALTALTNPEVRIEIFGSRRGVPIRLHVGVRGEIACIAAQQPGVDEDAGGEVGLRAVHSSDVGRALAATLAVVPGQPQREWRFTGGRSTADEQAKERELATMFAGGLDAVIPVGILAGPAIDWRSDDSSHTFDIVSVRDHGDLIVNRAARQVVSATPERTAKAFDTYVAAVRKIYEGRR
ncbi:hypothetical protein GPOL_c32830 [Gordonia polyisoprenivorans VH2]|uniref:ESX secretion-associated protein EspG n=3 Tax=Gordonia polyisoprenivorans TaxID=84595 RepID=H6MY70_GORPV|nr:hypothetical protein GPOL_c32830 [Gordonia polyisoprenivorans VH2]MBE7193137.1 ESX secretion-associated protein EspG [Gordonia polyisoprenivorans]NKY04063.1 ESX secretion-associated protein EspG [Gordonia polyisoprenivorans]GAB26110.1 hypothetical protein GOPIP_092_00280 [Gordonia polyisoprenivorans NBRC 16320 = JCM 10675]